jgi:hypothetical protein
MIVFFMEQPSPEKALMQNASQENRSTPLDSWTADSKNREQAGLPAEESKTFFGIKGSMWQPEKALPQRLKPNRKRALTARPKPSPDVASYAN